jgi:hypothetical protein
MPPDTSTSDEIFRLLDKSAQALAGRPDAATQLSQQFHQAAGYSTELAHFGLLPLCLALLVLHEQYRAATDGSNFRIASVLGRTAVVAAAIVAYGKLCALITGIAGAGGHWMASSEILGGVEQSSNAVGDAWEKLGGLSDWPKFALLLLMSFILLCATLLAYVAGLLISVCQGAILAILLIVGKPCIAVSLVPGVGVAKSWARALGQVAAWSTVAGILSRLLGSRHAEVQKLIADGQILPMLKAAAEFIIFAVSMLSVPKIVSMIFSGAVTAVSGSMTGALMAAYVGAKSLGRSNHREKQTSHSHGTSQDGGGENRRPHKNRRPPDETQSPRGRA